MKLWEYAALFMGVPYRWGGDDPLGGLDCSGFIQEVLASKGLDPVGDQSAQGLHDALIAQASWRSQLGEDAILFFGEHKKAITHVAVAINDKQMIEAGGGGSKTTSLEMAIKQNAFIRIRPIRKDLVAVLKYVG